MKLEGNFQPLAPSAPPLSQKYRGPVRRQNEALFQRLGLADDQRRDLTKEVGRVLKNFARLTNGFGLTAVYHEGSPWAQGKPFKVVPEKCLIHIALESSPDNVGNSLPVKLGYFLAALLEDGLPWHQMKVRTNGTLDEALECYLSSGAPSSSSAQNAFRGHFPRHLNDLTLNYLHNELSRDCLYPARQMAVQVGAQIAAITREICRAAPLVDDKGLEVIDQMTWRTLAKLAFLVTVLRKAGLPGAVSEIEASAVRRLGRELSYLQLSRGRTALFANRSYETELQLTKHEKRDLAIYEGFCRAYEYWYDLVRVVSAHN